MMAYRSQAAAFLMALVFFFGLPAGLLVPPPEKAHATWPTLPTDFASNILAGVYKALSYVVQKVEEYYKYLMYIKEWILEPLAFIQSGKATQALTGGMLNFVSGGSSGTGRPQFVQNLAKQLRSPGDNTTSAFLRQLKANSDSPYTDVIAASLRSAYAEQTSLAGFFAANRNTLPQFSPNPSAYLSGNWSQGGLSAWFALTTEAHNNPYLMHRRAEQKLGLLLGAAERAVVKQLDWGDGFLSWCGDAIELKEGDTCDAGGYAGTWTDEVCIQDEASDAPPAAEVPGAPCTNKDGTQSKIETPGTTITKFMDESLGLDAKKLTAMGNAATQITEMISGIMSVVTLTQSIISGPGGGLASANRPGGPAETYASTTTGYAGASNCTINQNLGEQSVANGEDVLARIEQYKGYWEIIGPTAVTADTALRGLITACQQNLPSISNTVDRKVGQSEVISRKVAAQRVIDQATAALATSTGIVGKTLFTYENIDNAMASTTEFVNGLDDMMTAIDPETNDCTVYDPNRVRNLVPSAEDVVRAEQDTLDGDVSVMVEPWLVYFREPEDFNDIEGLSFNLENGSLVDKMTLIAETAQDPEIVELCTP